MASFARFAPAAAITAETIARHADAAPSGLPDVWREQGAGLVGDGYVRVVDPDHAVRMLDGVLNLGPQVVPVFTTALADLVVFSRPAFHIVRFRRGVIDFLAFEDSTGAFYRNLEDEQFLDGVLERQPYPEAAARLGVPGIDECFAYVPLLALGGPEDPARLDRAGLWEHLAITVQLAGAPTPRTVEA